MDFPCKTRSVTCHKYMSAPTERNACACLLYTYAPELVDAVAISTLGEFGSKAGAFVGRNMFGYGSQNGYSITNLGKIKKQYN